MKLLNITVLVAVISLTSLCSFSQVNLDRPYLGKTGNTLFFDTHEPKLIWSIPKFLEATNANDIVRVGDEYRVRFNVSFPEKSKVDLAPQEEGSPLVFRAFRATQVSLETFADIDPKLNPTISALGDYGMFGESIPYMMSLQTKKYPISARHTAKHLFDGKNMLVLGRVNYYFSALRGGQPFEAQSTVAIIIPKRVDKKSRRLSGEVNNINEVLNLQSANERTDIPSPKIESVNYNPLIQYHSQTGCWGQVNEGIICLKDMP